MDFLYIVSLGIGKAFHQWRNPAEDVTLLCFGWCYSDRGVHLRPYDFATEEAHQDFEDRAEKKQGERRRLRLASNDGAGKCSSGLFFLVIVDPFNTWLSILLVSTSLIQLHPVSDFALRRSGEKPAPEFMKWDDAVAVLKNDASKASNIFVLLKIRRGPKLEGCAFANFGYSSGTEGEPNQKKRKWRKRKKKGCHDRESNPEPVDNWPNVCYDKSGPLKDTV